MRGGYAAFPLLLILCAAAGCRAAPEPVQAGAAAEIVAVEVATASGVRRIRATVARDDAAQEQGLMHRTAMADDEGMLFPFPAPRIASFWMANTAIPLDMIFVRADGTIARIAEETVPFSREPVLSDEPVVAVLEVAGGRAAAMGIAAGDRVAWPGGPGLNPGPAPR